MNYCICCDAEVDRPEDGAYLCKECGTALREMRSKSVHNQEKAMISIQGPCSCGSSEIHIWRLDGTVQRYRWFSGKWHAESMPVSDHSVKPAKNTEAYCVRCGEQRQ